ncbi:Type-1 restriction enzyme EcoKI specificity protein [compost metagenome]
MSNLPLGWAETTLGEIVTLRGDKVDPGSVSEKSFIGLEDIEPHTSAILRVGQASKVKSSVACFEAGDVLYSRLRPYLNKVTCPDFSGVASAEILALVPSDAAEAEFVRRKIMTRAFLDFTAMLDKGDRPRVSYDEIAGFPFPLPPIPEQRRIVAKIDSLTGKSRCARDHLDHIPRLVEKYKEAILAAAFRGDLTREWREQNRSARWSESELVSLQAQRESYLNSRRGSRLHVNHAADPVPVPIGWFDAQLADVGQLQVGYAYKSKWYAPDGVRLLRGANIAPGKVTWDDEARLPVALAEGYLAYSLDAGDIVIAMDRPLISSGLKVARIEPEDAGCLLVQRVARYVPSELVEPDYAWHLINSQHFIEHAVTQATGSDLPHISSNDILTTPMPLPCRAEQREIARRVTAALSWIDRLAADANSARKLIDHLDQALLAKAFKGELVPQDPSDEPASILLERIRAERATTPKAKRGRKKAA